MKSTLRCQEEYRRPPWSFVFYIEKGQRVLAIRFAKWDNEDIKRISEAAGLRLAKSWKTVEDDYGMVPLRSCAEG